MCVSFPAPDVGEVLAYPSVYVARYAHQLISYDMTGIEPGHQAHRNMHTAFGLPASTCWPRASKGAKQKLRGFPSASTSTSKKQRTGCTDPSELAGEPGKLAPRYREKGRHQPGPVPTAADNYACRRGCIKLLSIALARDTTRCYDASKDRSSLIQTGGRQLQSFQEQYVVLSAHVHVV